MKKTFTGFIMAVIAFAFLYSCDNNDTAPAAHTFVLVHGAWQASYVWATVKAELESRGQKVITVELPAHGEDTTSAANVSIEAYRDRVVEAINSVGGKVVLVGHSMGGVVVSAVAEKIPAQIEKLVYIGAFVPANGQSLLDLAFQDTQSLLGLALVPSADQLTLDIIHDSIVPIFCQDGTDEVKNMVLDHFRVEPAIPFGEKAVLTAANFGSVSKYYIHTLQDHAIGMDLQNKMAEAAGITNLYEVNTGHSPFLTKPDDVTNILMNIIK